MASVTVAVNVVGTVGLTVFSGPNPRLLSNSNMNGAVPPTALAVRSADCPKFEQTIVVSATSSIPTIGIICTPHDTKSAITAAVGPAGESNSIGIYCLGSVHPSNVELQTGSNVTLSKLPPGEAYKANLRASACTVAPTTVTSALNGSAFKASIAVKGSICEQLTNAPGPSHSKPVKASLNMTISNELS